MILRKLKAIKRKLKQAINEKYFPYLIKNNLKGELKALHVSAFSYCNAGDTLLPVVLRDLFNQKIGIKTWDSVQVYKEVDGKLINKFNNCNFSVIGGGGLFLSDTQPNDVSGWQWNCSIPALLRIEKPIIVFAVGYNRFRGQEDFKPIFTQHLNAFVSKAEFVGIRNHGSIEKLKTYLETDELKNKLTFQPCMTTLISKIYPDLAEYTAKEDCVAFNCAFDRKGLRSSDTKYLESIAKVALEMSKRTKIMYYSHMPSDNEILPYFDALNVPYELVKFKNVKQIVTCYSKPRLVIGMRGHAQMIPFGCGTPILSIISHDKMQWFLDDINHPEWGADVLDADFEQKLLSKALSLYSNYQECMHDIEIEKERLWDITMNNMNKIKNIIEK